MRKLIILVEEPSMAIILRNLCNRICPNREFKIIEHNGKKELDDSFPKKIRAWQDDVNFLIVRDKDSHPNCFELKQKLLCTVPDNKKSNTKIRIVMNELESWYLSDLSALVEAELITLSEFSRVKSKAKFRNIENLNNAKQEFFKLVKSRGQRDLARKIAPYLDPSRSTSRSFKFFCNELAMRV